ncbi:hypothetical protein D8B26_000167 [Coccidioides posadasii str. Silveira]|nr:hypothetical protein CPC735_066240 [Coccidioides posadasii C735 delta SOWgp]EER25524.1 hypothetical protein CPC735_066240 [Coccidioides posadasii C735 delta SOWgp]KMM70907.1 hypothetical protein CPAG_07216 [Coccidioides posadasii RMSCC 3488]QVM05458.1 hypothetical protein D8B26_000167 [Coccidioides posadasii str. Silveira]|eukprot:XP_003067669.1 hypothetical protein CPC735_066240 [Coccidioides posadasii C735 delta SOWgp]
MKFASIVSFLFLAAGAIAQEPGELDDHTSLEYDDIFDDSAVLETRSLINSACTGKDGAEGVCISVSDCNKGGGEFINNACPGTPQNIKCCTKTKCGDGGNCRFTDKCSSGNILSGQCPGPASFKCCLPKELSGRGRTFPKPRIPSVGACKRTSVNGAKKIVAAQRGKIREIGCYRRCRCPSNSEHCCGLAVDLMCTSRAGKRDRDDFGRAIAEWVMKNRRSLKLKYVIWGQRIWNPSRDRVAPWNKWRKMEDRGSITQNHWDHVHVSFN